MLDPFTSSDAFSMTSLTRAINILPNNYGRVREMNLMPGKGVRTRTIAVEEKNGVLNLLQTQPVGSPGLQNSRGKRTVRNFTIPHIPLDDVIMPESYQGVRAFGSENDLTGIAQVVNDVLQTMRNKHAITLEHLRMGALKGIILDADATTLYNLYTEFGISQKTVSFAMATSTTDIPAKCRAVSRHIEDNLKGEVMSGVHCLCSETFFDGLVGHDSVKEAYLNWSAAAERIGEDTRKGFKFQGITFEEYRGTADDIDGNARAFITAGDAHFFPVGTMSTFETLFAPADFNETANTLGLELYAHQEPRKHNRGVDLHTQSNPLPICYRPGVLVKGTYA
ncbi:major capsid protein [Desulfosarcina ovata]|uniref:Minor capsid protein E n=1 Tax=Desulfosarcina ovata subsp. ovata TaxID=2752305 RepID=A0A5K8AHV7_9BACT|nr:major capsid protein [Desulfosarcina ovata]BBO92056.1 minor capsid protein E [Desulfosarcina ovata subsp. ovata]